MPHFSEIARTEPARQALDGAGEVEEAELVAVAAADAQTTPILHPHIIPVRGGKLPHKRQPRSHGDLASGPGWDWGALHRISRQTDNVKGGPIRVGTGSTTMSRVAGLLVTQAIGFTTTGPGALLGIGQGPRVRRPIHPSPPQDTKALDLGRPVDDRSFFPPPQIWVWIDRTDRLNGDLSSIVSEEIGNSNRLVDSVIIFFFFFFFLFFFYVFCTK